MKRMIFGACLGAALALVPGGSMGRASDTVEFTPGPGFTLRLPANWIACEDASEKLLRSAPDVTGLKPVFCSRSAGVPSTLRAFDPNPTHLLGVIVDWTEHQEIPEGALAAVTQPMLDRIQEKLCDVAAKPLMAAGGAVDSCVVSVGEIAHHRALISNFVEFEPGDRINKVLIDSYEFPYAQGYVQIQFTRPQAMAAIVQPQIDAIIASMDAH